MTAILFVLIFGGFFYLVFGPFEYEAGSRRLYKRNKEELREFVQLYTELNQTHGFHYYKSQGKSIFMYPNNDTSQVYKVRNSPELDALIAEHGWDKKKFDRMLDLFFELHLTEASYYGEDKVEVGVKSLFPVRKAALLFCIDKEKPCDFYNWKMIDTDVAYANLNDCC